MAGIDLATAEAHLATWLDAEAQIALGQSFAHQGRALTRADLGQVRKQIEFWMAHVDRLSACAGAGPPRIQRIIVVG